MQLYVVGPVTVMLYENHSLIMLMGRSRFSVHFIHEDLHKTDMLETTMGELLGQHTLFEIFSLECCKQVIETQWFAVMFSIAAIVTTTNKKVLILPAIK